MIKGFPSDLDFSSKTSWIRSALGPISKSPDFVGSLCGGKKTKGLLCRKLFTTLRGAADPERGREYGAVAFPNTTERKMENQGEENNQTYDDRKVHHITHNKVLGILYPRQRESTVTFELVVVVMLSRDLMPPKTKKIHVDTLFDLWMVVKEAQAWIEKEMNGPAKLSLSKFSVWG